MDYLGVGSLPESHQSLSPLTSMVSPSDPPGASPAGGSGDGREISFKDMVKGFLTHVNDLQIQADQKMQEFAAGKIQNLHEVMIAAEKAGLALQFTIQVRNRVIEAYENILRMQV